MNKFIKKLKDYSIFLLFLIPLMIIIFYNKSPDNDIWFLLSCGRYVFSNGIPTIEPFTIHEGFSYLMQQWLSASIFWGVFNVFGKYGILTLMYFVSFLLIFVFYKLCRVVGCKRNISVILTVLVFTIAYVFEFIVTRPQVFTYLILLLEILLMELYVKRGNVKVLYIMPILSIFLINLHATMWYFQFVFMLPFFVNSFYIKKICIDKYKLKPLLIVASIMLLVGFINPYGLNAMTFVFKSYGIANFNDYIGEMKIPSFKEIEFKICLLCLFFLIFLMFINRKKRFDLRHILFICGTLLLYMMHAKCFPYFCLSYFYALAFYFRDFKLDLSKIKIFSNKYFCVIFNSFKYSCFLFIFLTFCFFVKWSYQFYNFYPVLTFDRDCEIIADYIEDNYDLEKVRLFTQFNDGGYYIYRGMKVYIDPRAEVFLKVNNGKEDVFDEFVKLLYKDIDFEKFLNKYNFTHLIVDIGSKFDKYLSNDPNYEVVYVLNFDNVDNQPIQNLYVNKNLVQEVLK